MEAKREELLELPHSQHTVGDTAEQNQAVVSESEQNIARLYALVWLHNHSE